MIRDNADRMSRFYSRRTKRKKQIAFTIREPTVFDVDEFEAAERERTIRQIINGQCAYYGTEIEPTPDPPKGVARERLDNDRIMARLRETWQRLKAE